MNVITHSQLRALVEAGVPPCVSIFLPTHPGARESRGDLTEFKNLLRAAEEPLSQRMRPTEARDFLEPARRLLDDESVWANARQGVACFLAPDFFRFYYLPIEVEPAAIVNDRFHVKPLLPILLGKLFYVLAVSQHHARLLECSELSCKCVDLPGDVALSLQDAIRGERDSDPDTERHTGDSSRAYTGAGVYHGQATDLSREQHEDLMFYLRQLDEGANRVIHDPDAPLILAGDIHITPSYRAASKHRNILEETIRGNPEHVSNETLHTQAMEILEPYWRAELNKQQERFGAALAQHIASHDLADIVEAALAGRVDTLFVAPRAKSYGYVEPMTMTVDVHDDPQETDEDLIDRATTQTLMTSGSIVVVNPEQMPGNGEIAAIYRY